MQKFRTKQNITKAFFQAKKRYHSSQGKKYQQQNLAKANQLAKAIEEKRKAIKQPYLDAGKKVDEVAKTLSESIEKGIKHIKDQVADWEKKRREEEAKKKQILDYINGELSARLQQLYKRIPSSRMLYRYY